MTNISNTRELYEAVSERLEHGAAFVLATVLKSDGSTPQKIGVKAIVSADGEIWGTIGGGLVEAEAVHLGKEACRSGEPCVFDFQLNDPYRRDAGPICGGSMRILLDPTVRKNEHVIGEVLEGFRERKRGVLLTQVNHTESLSVKMDWKLAEESDNLSVDNTAPQLTVVGSPDSRNWVETLLEPIVPSPRLLIVGGGHVGQALAVQGIWNGFEVVVIEDRPEFSDPALFPGGVRIERGAGAEGLRSLSIDPDSYIALVNRGHKQDAETLELCIHSNAAYIGMIGSRRKIEMIRRDFIATGLATEEEFDRVYAPIGLDIGSVTVNEIATSIMAQVISVRRKGHAEKFLEAITAS